MEKLNEIFLKYSNKTIIVILDKNNKPWFNAFHISMILKYKKPRNTIKQLVDKEYIKNLKHIVKNYKVYHNAKPDSLFINESGVYALLLRSKKKAAKKFYKWVVEKVLPSIRTKGYYELEATMQSKVDELNKQLDEKNQRIKILENNQSTKHITKGKYIYIIKSADNKIITLNSIDTYKLGKTIKFNPRMNTINTSTKDNALVLYRAKIDDISAVENCIKGLLSKQVYRSNKEYYIITLKEAIKVIKSCIKLTKSKLISEDKFYKNFINKSSNKVKRIKNIFHEPINFVFDNKHTQNGGFLQNNKYFNTFDNILELYKVNKIIFKQFNKII